MLDASDILSTPPSGARSLFEGLGGTAAGFRRLARDWHPDVNRSPRAAEVFAHLMALRTAAEVGTRPARDAVRSLRGTDGRTFEMRHLRARTFDAGEILVGRTSLAYLVAPDFDDLAEAAAKRRPAFADAAMRREMERFLPAALGAQETTSGRVLTYARAPGQVLLADLVAHLGGTVEPVHAAWITSGLMNLCCWLGWAGLSHGWIGPETVLVSPSEHTVSLTGPFLFAARIGARPAALPERTLSALPRCALPGAEADARVDLELARLTVREALGDPGGGKLLAGKAVPRDFALWLSAPPAAAAAGDYAGWERARQRAFGPRRFVEMKVSPVDVYGA